jgi:cell division protein FtsW (lipid II flippase)
LAIACLFATAKSFGYTLVMAGIMSIAQLGMMVEQYIPQEIGWYSHSRFIIAPRFYMAADLFIMFALPLVISLALWAKARRIRVVLYCATASLCLGLLSSQTRGLWLAAMLALAVVFWLSNLGNRLKIAIVLPLILLAVFALSQDFFPSVRDTIRTSFDPTEASNYGKISQVAPLMDMAGRHIILGNGFGAYAADHPGVDPKEPWGYEMQAPAMLMKMGIVGCGLWGLFLGWLLWDLWRIHKRAQDPMHRAVGKGLLGAMVGMLFASGTNPYFCNSCGMGALLFTVIVIDLVGQQLAPPLPLRAGKSHANVLSGGQGTQSKSPGNSPLANSEARAPGARLSGWVSG